MQFLCYNRRDNIIFISAYGFKYTTFDCSSAAAVILSHYYFTSSVIINYVVDFRFGYFDTYT